MNAHRQPSVGPLPHRLTCETALFNLSLVLACSYPERAFVRTIFIATFVAVFRKRPGTRLFQIN